MLTIEPNAPEPGSNAQFVSAPGVCYRNGKLEVRFVASQKELEEVLRLRFEVFNLELGEGLESSYDTGLDRDEFDSACYHLIVVDRELDKIVGTYRMQTYEMAASSNGFYTATEFDLATLPVEVFREAVEVGRACIAKEYRNSRVLFMLWRGLAGFMATYRKRFLFGCCSLTSQDPVEGKAVMDYLVQQGHIHPQVHIDPQPGYACYPLGFAGDDQFPVKIPKLFRIYLNYGAKVCGPPAIDRLFKTIDYFVMLDVQAMDPKQFAMFFA